MGEKSGNRPIALPSPPSPPNSMLSGAPRTSCIRSRQPTLTKLLNIEYLGVAGGTSYAWLRKGSNRYLSGFPLFPSMYGQLFGVVSSMYAAGLIYSAHPDNQLDYLSHA